jgi:two-component system, sensor histidine kinase LadS
VIFRLLLVCILNSFIFANTFVIDKKQDIYNMNEFHIYEDKNNSLNIDSIVNNKQIFTKSGKTNLGIKKYPIWAYSKIINKTKETKQLIFSNPRAGTDFIDVYILDENKILKQFFLGDMTAQEKREFVYRKSEFLLELEPNKEYEIIIRYKSFGAIDINWEIYEQNLYLSYITKESLIFGLIGGIILLILTYIIFIDRIFPSISHKIYFFIMIGSLVTQFSVTGIFYQMGVPSYINTILSWSVGTAAAAFIGIFPIFFFNLKKLMPKTTILLYILNSGLVIFSIVYLFYPLKNDLLYLSSSSNLLFLIVSLVLIYVSIRLYLQKVEGYFYYLLGNTAFTIAVVYFSLGLLGIVKADGFFYFSLGIGSVLNILFMGMAIVERLLRIKKEKEEALILINKYSKLSTIGQAMINISHQWKEPINHIYYAINNIQAAKEFKDSNLENIIDESLKDIKNTTIYMQDTGKNFLNLYEDTNKIEKLNILDCVYFSLSILRNEFDKLNIDIKINSSRNYSIQSDKYLLSNVFIVIFENALKVFKLNHIENPFLQINILKEDDFLIIKISDNAGGIKVSPIENIFKQDITDSLSTGLGLFLAKSILTMKLNGDIRAENIDDGACFIISLK